MLPTFKVRVGLIFFIEKTHMSYHYDVSVDVHQRSPWSKDSWMVWLPSPINIYDLEIPQNIALREKPQEEGKIPAFYIC